MNGNTGVDERARAVGSLVERSEICRSIFARVALVIGTLSILLAVGIYLNDETKFTIGRSIRAREFATLWATILIVELLVSLFLLAREAKRSGRPFLSMEFKFAFNQLKPFPIIPAAFTGWFFTTGFLGAQELNLVVVWIAFYGLMLLLHLPVCSTRRGGTRLGLSSHQLVRASHRESDRRLHLD